MNEPPGARLRVALSALTMAEHFRDKGLDILLFVDNIFRFTQAGSEVSALLGRMPSAVGYQPTLSSEMGELQERITSTKSGSITSIQAVYVPADDITDPAAATVFTHLDATTVLSRQIAEKGIYPAVDPLASTSRILYPYYVGEEHYAVAQAVLQVLQRYRDLQDIIAILGLRRALGGGQGNRGPARGASSAFSASRSSSRNSSPASAGATSSSPTRWRASGRSSAESATPCPSRPSCTSAPWRRSGRRRRRWPRHEQLHVRGVAPPTASPRRGTATSWSFQRRGGRWESSRSTRPSSQASPAASFA